MQKVLKTLYIVFFITILFIPFLFAHREENRIAESENRYYANVPKFWDEDGKINANYIQDFEAWINDNARFRSLFREIKVTALYHLFGYLDLENVGIGTNGELYANAMKDVDTMQGRNLLSDDELAVYENNLYQLKEWLQEKNIDFYYMQCYDKMTMLDEYYPSGAVRYDTRYIGEHTEEYVLGKNRIQVVPLYDLLKSAVKSDNLYYKYVDWCHWNDAGMYLGYEKLMATIREKYPELDYLTLEDYEITEVSSFRDVYGFRYPFEEVFPVYEIKDKRAKQCETEFYDRLKVKEYTYYYENPVGKMRILSINDSFIGIGMKSHLAESFKECLSMNMENLSNIEWIIEEYQPDIVLLECIDTNIPRLEEILNSLECIKE